MKMTNFQPGIVADTEYAPQKVKVPKSYVNKYLKSISIFFTISVQSYINVNKNNQEA